MNIYVKNMAWETGEKDLRKLFEKYGTVDRVVMARETKNGASKCAAVVSMPNKSAALKAVKELKGRDFMGKPLWMEKTHAQFNLDKEHRDSKSGRGHYMKSSGEGRLKRR